MLENRETDIGITPRVFYSKVVLVRIDRWYPSSRTCSCCGKIKHDLKLEERVYLCNCGNRMDRDENAAINICREGLRISGIILEKSEKAS